jgi:hypothetical protein
MVKIAWDGKKYLRCFEERDSQGGRKLKPGRGGCPVLGGRLVEDVGKVIGNGFLAEYQLLGDLVRVSRRTSAFRRRCRAETISRSRPKSGVGCAGRLCFDICSFCGKETIFADCIADPAYLVLLWYALVNSSLLPPVYCTLADALLFRRYTSLILEHK